MALEKVGVQLEAKDYQKFVSNLTAADKAMRTFTTTFTTSMLKAARAAQATNITDMFKNMLRELDALSKSAILKRAAGFPEFVTEIEKQAERLQELTQKRLGDLGIGMAKMIPANLGKLRVAYAKFFEETGLGARVWGDEVAEANEKVQKEQKKTEETTNEFGNALLQLAQKGQMLPGVLGKMSGGLASMGKMFTAGSLGAVALGTAVGVGLIVGLNAVIKVIGKVISKVKELTVAFAKAAASLIEKAATMAGRFNEMELAAIATGRGVGLADETILKAIKSVNAMNIRYDVAAASVMRMARVQIDLKYATDLVRIAQAIAVETNRDSSEEMTSLTHALTTNNVQMLRRHGIIIDNDRAERKYAEANDLVVGSLTARQKIEAQVQAVIRESTHLMGVYEAAMRSGSKIMRSIEGRVIPEFVAALGAPMQGAFTEVAQAAFDFLEALTASITEGGKFYPIMVRIGAVLQIVGEQFAGLARNLTAFFKPAALPEELYGNIVTGFRGTMMELDKIRDDESQSFTEWASDIAIAAFEWGAEIMAQFARGLAAGLRFVGEAMLLIAEVLGSWLAPGSPPKIAPDIAKWGAAAMAEYLRGFGMVDFGAFEGIQKVLGRLLSGPGLASLLGEVIEAMSTGTVGKDLFARISAAAGAYGAEIVKLTKLQFAYADALRAVEAAQLALNRAQAAVKDHSLEVDKLVREYNELLKAGASDEILDTRLDEINMSERARNMAIVERDEAQVAIKLAEERLEPIKEALALQEKLVDVLLDLATAQADVVEETKKAASGAADAILEEFGNLGARVGDEFKTNMQKAIDKIKEDIGARLKDIFQPVWDAWFGKPEWVMTPWGVEQPTGQMAGGVVQAFEGVRLAFDKLVGAFNEVDWEDIKEKIGTFAEAMTKLSGPLGDIVGLLLPPTVDEVVEGLNDLADALRWLRENLAWLLPLLQGRPFTAIEGWLGQPGNREAARGALAPMPGTAGGGGGKQLQSMTEQGPGGSMWSALLQGFLAAIGTSAATDVLNKIVNFFRDDVLGGDRAPNLNDIGISVDTGVSDGMLLPDAVGEIFAAMEDIAKQMLAQAQLDSGSDLEKTVIKVGAAFTRLIAKGIKDNVWRIVEALRAAMEEAQKLVSEGVWWAGPGAPPPPGGGGGGGSAQQGGYSPRGGIHHPGEYVIPAGLTRALMSPVSHTSNFTFNNDVSSQIDVAHLNAMVRNMVRGEIARAH